VTTAPADPILPAAAPAPEAPHHPPSGQKCVALARFIRSRRLHDAFRRRAFAALSVSTGARARIAPFRRCTDGLGDVLTGAHNGGYGSSSDRQLLSQSVT